jgi:hypothetical protein
VAFRDVPFGSSVDLSRERETEFCTKIKSRFSAQFFENIFLLISGVTYHRLRKFVVTRKPLSQQGCDG